MELVKIYDKTKPIIAYYTNEVASASKFMGWIYLVDFRQIFTRLTTFVPFCLHFYIKSSICKGLQENNSQNR